MRSLGLTFIAKPTIKIVLDVFRWKPGKGCQNNVPACLGSARQLLWPYFWTWDFKIWSSSTVHGPLFNPIFSQQGALTMSFFFVVYIWTWMNTIDWSSLILFWRTMIFTNWSQTCLAIVDIYIPNSKNLHMLEKSKDWKD